MRRPSLAGTRVAHRPAASQRRHARSPVAPAATAAPEAPAAEAAAGAAGGQLDWHAQWYPIVYTKDVPSSNIYKFTLLEQPM